MENYPFVKCLNPQSIINPYTNERLLVECGKCKACRIRKGAIASMKCKRIFHTSTQCLLH